MKRIYIAFFALLATTLCACSPTPSGSAPAAASTASSPTATVAAMNTAEMEKMIIELEKKTWEVYRTKNIEDFKKMIAPGAKSIYFGGIKNFEEGLNDIKDIEFKSLSLSDWQVMFPIKDTAIVTYKGTASSTYKGKDTSGSVVSSAVWVNLNGEWKQTFYAEARAEQPPKK